MADYFDTFAGASGALSGHTADSGDTWGPTGMNQLSLNGSGSVSLTGTFNDANTPYSTWTPPGTDYSARIVVGASWRAIARSCGIGPTVRPSGPSGSVSNYQIQIYDGGSGSDVVVIQCYTGSATVGLAPAAWPAGSRRTT